MRRSGSKVLALAAGVLAAVGGCQSRYLQDCSPSGPPDRTECKVVFFRSGGTPDSSSYPIYHELAWIGDSEPGCYFEVRCAPGKHHFIILSGPPGMINAETISRSPANFGAVEADLAPGKTYYVRSFVQAVHLTGGKAPRLVPVTRDSPEAREVILTLGDLQCTRLDPAKTAGEKARVEARIRTVYREISEVSGVWSHLGPEDGQ